VYRKGEVGIEYIKVEKKETKIAFKEERKYVSIVLLRRERFIQQTKLIA